MMERHPWLAGALLACASGCAGGTALDVEALGLPGVEVRSEDGSAAAVIDEEGFATLLVADRFDADVTLEVRRGDVAETLRAECLPPVTPSPPQQPLDEIQLYLRREIATGRCVLIAYEMRQGDQSWRGAYEPERFDDQPCGPFAEP